MGKKDKEAKEAEKKLNARLWEVSEIGERGDESGRTTRGGRQMEKQREGNARGKK